MLHELQDLIKEYRKSLRLLRSAKTVPLLYSSMVSDTQFAIEIMETGRIPKAKWAVARYSKERREVLVDPLMMANLVSNRKPAKSTPEWKVKLLDLLMSKLTARERQAYELVRGQLYSFSQAASIMGCNKGSVQNFVARAEKKINSVVRLQQYSEGTFLEA